MTLPRGLQKALSFAVAFAGAACGCSLEAYRQDVETRAFPEPEHGVNMKDEVWAELIEELS